MDQYLYAGRVEAVRQAMVKALETLYDVTKNPNREHTYINVIMFGSYNSKAISLTEWATRSESSDGGPTSSSTYILPGIRRTSTSGVTFTDNTLRASVHGSPKYIQEQPSFLW